MRELRTLSADGFSVIEALAATALLVIALSPVYSMLQQLSDAATRSMHLTDAAHQYRLICALINTGETLPENINGWQVNIEKNSSPTVDESIVDGYLGGDFFNLTTISYQITLTKGNFQYINQLSDMELTPIYETPEDAIFSRF
jgi:Tfp pilus assembly protein PilV